MKMLEIDRHIVDCGWQQGRAFLLYKTHGNPADLADARAWKKLRQQAQTARRLIDERRTSEGVDYFQTMANFHAEGLKQRFPC